MKIIILSNAGWRIAPEPHTKGAGHERNYHVRRKPYNKAIAAVARELAGFVWSVLYDRGYSSRLLHDSQAATNSRRSKQLATN